MFLSISDIVEASSKINIRTLDDDVASGNIISYTQRSNGSFEVLKLDSIKSASKKVNQHFYLNLMYVLLVIISCRVNIAYWLVPFLFIKH